MRVLLFFIILFILFFLYVKYLEVKSIFFPSKAMESSPLEYKLPYEDVFVKTSDKAFIHGWFVAYPRAQNTVLYCHGNAGNISHRLEIVRIFHNLKMNVLAFDFRGYGMS